MKNEYNDEDDNEQSADKTTNNFDVSNNEHDKLDEFKPKLKKADKSIILHSLISHGLKLHLKYRNS